MTDPFEAFESNLAAPTVAATQESTLGFDDPAAAFLAREQAEMAKIESNGNGLGIDDGFGDFGGEIASKPLKQDPTISSGFESSNDLFGTTNGDSNGDTNGHSLTNGTSSHSIPEFNENNNEQNGESENKDFYSAIHSMDQLSVEAEKIKTWREEQKQRLQTKDADEEQKKKDWKESAKKELEDWYRNRQEQLQKTHENNKGVNRSAEAEMVESRDSSGQMWEKVAKLCEFNPKANKNVRDVSRMRSILLQLKQQPLIR